MRTNSSTAFRIIAWYILFCGLGQPFDSLPFSILFFFTSLILDWKFGVFYTNVQAHRWCIHCAKLHKLNRFSSIKVSLFFYRKREDSYFEITRSLRNHITSHISGTCQNKAPITRPEYSITVYVICASLQYVPCVVYSSHSSAYIKFSTIFFQIKFIKKFPQRNVHY